MKDAGSGKEQAEDQFHGLYMKTQDSEEAVKYTPVTIYSLDEMVAMDPEDLPKITAKMVGVVIPRDVENVT